VVKHVQPNSRKQDGDEKANTAKSEQEFTLHFIFSETVKRDQQVLS
jgi:hypothetical protein